MTVRSVIRMYRGVKYKIDSKEYKDTMYIPEIVRGKTVDTHLCVGDLVVIYTREEVKTLEQCNKMLRDKHGEMITVQVRSYIEDDDSTWYYYTSAKYGDSDAYETLEEAYENANDYLHGVGELW